MNGNARKHRDTQSETQPSQQPLCCLASGPLMERVPTSGRLCSGVQTPSDPVSLFCVPGELAAAGWVLPAPAAGGPSGPTGCRQRKALWGDGPAGGDAGGRAARPGCQGVCSPGLCLRRVSDSTCISFNGSDSLLRLETWAPGFWCL